MNIAGDTHTHTLVCQHAYSTLLENIRAAAALGHRFIVTTEHGPAMPGAPYEWFFENLRKAVPREVEGVVVIKGCEADLMDTQGTLDVPDAGIKRLDLVMVSMHRVTFPRDTTPEQRTAAWCAVAKDPRVDVIGHLGDPRFQADYEAVIKAVKAGGQAVELNNSSPQSRPGSEPNCRRIAALCREYGVPVLLSTDAHFCAAIGQVDWSASIAREAGIPEEQILNLRYRRFRDWLAARKHIDDLPEE